MPNYICAWDCLPHMKISFSLYQVFSADLFAFILRKSVKLAVKINLAAATRFVDEIHLVEQVT